MPRFIAICLLLIASAAQAEPTAQAVAQQFYAAHFSGDMAFTAKSVLLKRQWLTPDLLQQIGLYFTRPVSSQQAPVINGDPFTNTQEYPGKFTVGEATQAPPTQTVPVTLRGSKTDIVTLVLRHEPSGWLIDDFLYPDGSSLRKLLLN